MTTYFHLPTPFHARFKQTLPRMALAGFAAILVGCGGAATPAAPVATPPPIQVNFAATPTEMPVKLPVQAAAATLVPTQAPPPATIAPAKPTSAPTVAPTVATQTTTVSKSLLPAPGQPAFEQPTHIVIPAIKVDAPVREAGIIINKQGQPEWDLPLGRVAAWHNNSSLMGQPGNLVLNGHNNIEGSIFAGLYDLKPGDKVILRSKSREVTYELSYYKLLKEKGEPISALIENAKYIEPTNDDRITLVTCWPITNNTHRWIWVGKPVEEKILTKS